MDQILFGAGANITHATATEYRSLVGASDWHAEEARKLMPCPSPGTLKTLKLVLETAPGAGTSLKFTLVVDGTPSVLTVTISDSDKTGSDLSNQISITAGQTVSLQAVPTNTPATVVAKSTIIFTGTTSKESVLMANTIGAVSNSENRFDALSTFSGTVGNTTELDVQQMCAGAGTIKNLYVNLSTDPGTSPDAYRFTVRKNGSSQSLTVTITANDTTGNDTVNSFTVEPGDLLNILMEPLNTPSASPRASWGVTFVADTDGESLVLCGTSNDIDVNTTEQNAIMHSTLVSWGSGGENTFRNMLDTCVFRDLHVELENAPGSGKSFTFSTRLDPDGDGIYVDGSLSVTISGTNKTGSDTSNSDSMDPDDSIIIQVAQSGNPLVGQAKWGFVMFIAAVAVGRGNLILKAMVAGGFA